MQEAIVFILIVCLLFCYVHYKLEKGPGLTHIQKYSYYKIKNIVIIMIIKIFHNIIGGVIWNGNKYIKKIQLLILNLIFILKYR